MNIIIDINHPAHVHLLRNLYHELLNNGHKVWVTVKDIPIAKDLLDLYKIKYIEIGKKRDSLSGKAFSQVEYNFKVLQLVKKNKIRIGIGTSMTLAHVSKLSKMQSIILDDDDDEVEPLFVKYAHPFANVILSPKSLIGHRKNTRTVFYSGYHELAYLHPKRFKPDKTILHKLGIHENDKFFILRFNAFKAHHDIGAEGINLEQKLKLVNLLRNYGKIFVTTEREIEPELIRYQLKVSPEKIHSLLYFATMYMGDSQTMASEAAILGTPALKCNSFAGKLSVPNELEKKYKLCYSFLPSKFDEYLTKIEILLNQPTLKQVWGNKRMKMLEDKEDVTGYLLWFIENYPNI